MNISKYYGVVKSIMYGVGRYCDTIVFLHKLHIVADIAPNDVKARIADSSKSPIMLSAGRRCFLIFLFLAFIVAVVACCLMKYEFLASIVRAIVVVGTDDTGVSGSAEVTTNSVPFCAKAGFENVMYEIGGGF